MRPCRITILSASVGAGHTRAAGAMLAWSHGLPLEVVHRDTLQMMPRAFQKLYIATPMKGA